MIFKTKKEAFEKKEEILKILKHGKNYKYEATVEFLNDLYVIIINAKPYVERS